MIKTPIHNSNRFLPLLLILLLLSCAPAKETTSVEDGTSLHEEITGLIVHMPAPDSAEQKWLNEQVMEAGPAGIQVLAGMLTPRGIGDDTQARYALNSLAKHVSRPGAEADRVEFERTLLGELQSGHSVEAKTFLMNQLERAGSDRSVQVLERFLADGGLYQPALDVLVTLRSPRAVQAIRDALSDSEGARRIAVMKALGDLQDAETVEEIRNYTTAEDWPTRRMAYYALAKSGSPLVRDVIYEALQNSKSNRRPHILSFGLTYADRLVEEGHYELSAEICRRFLNGDYPQQIQSTALHILFQIEGNQMLDELLEIAISSDPKLASSVLELINSVMGLEITEKLITALNRAPEARKAAFLETLAKRKDPFAAEALRSYLKGTSKQTRVSAARSLAHLAGVESLPDLIQALNRAEDKDEIEAYETALLQMPTNELIAASTEALPAASESAKPVLIRILTDRRASDKPDEIVRYAESEHKSVRREAYRFLQLLGGTGDLQVLVNQLASDRGEEELAAIQQAITAIVNRQEMPADRDAILLQTWEEASDSQKAYLLKIFPKIDGNETLSVVRKSLTHSDTATRRAAIAALAEWPDPQALPVLLEAAKVASDSLRLKVYAGYVRLVNRSEQPLEAKESLLHVLVNTTDSAEEKAGIISHFSGAGELPALQASGKYFRDEREQVREAAMRVASSLLASSYEPDSNNLNRTNTALAVLDDDSRRLLNEELNRYLKEQAQAEQPPEHDAGQTGISPVLEPVFGRLFNGQNLDGWKVIGGNPEGWGVENGVLYTEGEGSGWLSTTSTYDNFILELEYRVPDAGNSGVFLRAPHEGNPAYEGMEIQILDDYAEVYEELQPWQFTGSIYGVRAPSKRVTRPAGEWQRLRIRADGPEIRVTLNGEVIVNTSLIRYMELADRHPGLVRRSGYIGLQDHGDRVEFRRIVIHKIE